MRTFEDIELHDALLKAIDVNYVAKTVRLSVEYYKDANARSRDGVFLTLEGVESLSQIVDFARLENNAGAGNINYWVPTQRGTTYIYLVDGCIAIKADKLRIESA